MAPGLLKGKEEKNEDRLKRMQAELESVESGTARKAKGTLIIEFSIENVQVVKRRNGQERERGKVEVGIRFFCVM